ncbi:hypothetical protein BC628DRAFT_536719 [Trametes gibbosa]|nr:hypothetical protein BC628DRAFT_536719 [Trametes gibbosa]
MYADGTNSADASFRRFKASGLRIAHWSGEPRRLGYTATQWRIWNTSITQFIMQCQCVHRHRRFNACAVQVRSRRHHDYYYNHKRSTIPWRFIWQRLSLVTLRHLRAGYPSTITTRAHRIYQEADIYREEGHLISNTMLHGGISQIPRTRFVIRLNMYTYIGIAHTSPSTDSTKHEHPEAHAGT